MEISNKVIVVTGGAGGIGLAIAKEFIKESPKVVILVDISFRNFNFKEIEFEDHVKVFDGLPTNEKLKILHKKNNLPNIFGNYNKDSFFSLLKSLEKSNFELFKIKNLYFYKSGRWDIETNDNVIIKLPKKNLETSLNLIIYRDKLLSRCFSWEFNLTFF